MSCNLKNKRICPRERILDPPPLPINFVHDHFFFSKLVYTFRVLLGPLAFLGRALLLGQAMEPSAAARTG